MIFASSLEHGEQTEPGLEVNSQGKETDVALKKRKEKVRVVNKTK